MMNRSLPCGAAIALFALLCGRASAVEPVDSRVQQARQFQDAAAPNDPAPQSAQASTSLDAQDALATDDESFGEQQLLKRQEAPKFFNFYAGVSALYTNNVALTHRDGLSDGFLVGEIGLGVQRPITEALRAEFSLAGGAYRYDKFTELDFESVEAGGGLVYRAQALGNAEVFTRYSYTQLIGADSGDVFYQGHTFTLGVQKAWALSRAHGVYLGAAGVLSNSDPKLAQRNEMSLYGGYHLQATRHLAGDLLYRASYQHYGEGDRDDVNQLASFTLRYSLADWLSVNGTTSFSVNSSNRAAFRYRVLNTGIGLGLNLQF